MKTRTLFLTLLASILPLIFGLFVSVADANTKIAPTKASSGHPFTIIDTPEGRLIDGSVAVFRLGQLEVVLPGRTHKPYNTMQGRLAPDMIGGEYTVFVRQPDGSEFEIGQFTVLGGPTYSNASLDGDYLFIFKDISNPLPSILEFCDEEGTLSFDGNGTALVNSTQRCADGTNVTTTSSSATLFYEVNSDGSFTLGEQIADPRPLHGQIVLGGNSLLLDGTLEVSSATQLIKQIVAMKRVTAGSPPTYSNASLDGNFVFILNEIFGLFIPSPVFSDQEGTLSFNGDGTAQVDGTQRNADGTIVTTTPFFGMLIYEVNPNGSFTLGEQVGDPNALHGQIALDGNAMLLDGTLSPTQLFKQAIGMKRVTAGLPPTYSNASLEGDYLFIFNEIFGLFLPIPVFCDEEGTLSFDGSGTAMVNSTQRCSDGTTVTTTSSTGTVFYEVNSDGSFTLGEQIADPRPLHGQIVLDGSSFLLDGTLDMTSGGQLIKQAVGMKR
jgi:hypothetical protein